MDQNNLKKNPEIILIKFLKCRRARSGIFLTTFKIKEKKQSRMD